MEQGGWIVTKKHICQKLPATVKISQKVRQLKSCSPTFRVQRTYAMNKKCPSPDHEDRIALPSSGIKLRTSNLKLLILLLTFSACTYTLAVKDGRTAYDRKQFAVAVPMLQKEFGRAKVRSERGQLAFQLADSYRRTGRDEASLEWFKTAYDNNYGPEALKGYAYALKKLERYAAAREQFKALGIEIGSPYEYRKEITASTVAEGWIKEMKEGNGWKVDPAVFNSPQNDFATMYAPDGRLVFTSDRSGNPQLYVMDAEGGSVRRLSWEGNWNDSADWSPDGLRLVYVSRRGGHFKIWSMLADGGGPVAMTTGGGDDENPKWAPDGRKIVFSSTRQGRRALYTMNSDGSGVRRLTTLDAECYGTSWGPRLPR